MKSYKYLYFCLVLILILGIIAFYFVSRRQPSAPIISSTTISQSDIKELEDWYRDSYQPEPLTTFANGQLFVAIPLFTSAENGPGWGKGNGIIQSFDVATGLQRWSYLVPSPYFSNLFVYNGAVYVVTRVGSGGTKGKIYELSVSNGTLHKTLPLPENADEITAATINRSGGILFYATRGDNVVATAFDITGSKTLWESKVASPHVDSLLYTQNRIYSVYNGGCPIDGEEFGSVAILDSRSGQVIRKFSLDRCVDKSYVGGDIPYLVWRRGLESIDINTLH